jgi:putative endonuclease
MKLFCYIIYSKSLDRYYVGYTSDFVERLSLHKNGHFGRKSYTYKTSDWEQYLLIPCETIDQAVFVEARIKKMKSRRYIENLKRYPEIIKKILKEFHNK